MRQHSNSTRLLTSCALLLAACDGNGALDAGSVPDAGFIIDAGITDRIDAAIPHGDAGADSGPFDSGPVDSGDRRDAGDRRDGGIDASEVPDAATDAGIAHDAGRDAGVRDAGMDAGRARDGGFDAGAHDATHAILRVSVAGDGTALVRSDPPGLDCVAPCEASFPIGARVVLSVSPPYRTSVTAWDPAGLGCAGESCTIDLGADRDVVVELHRHTFVRLSETDRDPRVRLREDGLAADFYTHDAVRSELGVAPGAGVFYYEAHLLSDDRGAYGFGVATASEPVVATDVGLTDQSFGVMADGSVFYRHVWQARVGGGADRFGMIVDYRGSSPIVHVVTRALDGVHSTIAYSATLTAITEPLYIYLAGSKRVAGYQIEIEPGNDTTASPFALDPEGALRAAGLTAAADTLTLGWIDPYAGPPDSPPALTISSDLVVSAGTSVTVSASATDAEDGDLDPSIEWELLSTPHYAGRLRGSGPTFTFAPTAVGIHPALARVRDHAGHEVTAIVRVSVPGPVVHHDLVQLVHDPLSSSGAQLSPDALAARFTDPGKYGVRANQSLYGGTGYFEIRRLASGAVNVGGGLVTGDGDIAPYTWADVPGSCSVNMEGGVWRDLVWQVGFPGPASSFRTFGFAVDYRGEHPIVYVITGGEVIAELLLDDVWTEIYPMIYGNPIDTTLPGQYDERIDFGATPFENDPLAALSAYGVDVTGFTPRWGGAP